MNTKILKHAFGILSFLTALVTYFLTVQPSVPFWDCGEFSAASVWQQVPHPPGAPLFLMLGKLFHTLIPFGDPGWRINLASVFGSAFTILLLFYIIVMTIQNIRKTEFANLGEALAVYGAAFIGAAAMTFSDTFWFNAVESEVYATSSLFVGLVVFLMMKWNENADKPGHERYLLLLAYLMGLSTGVHLLALLAMFSIVYVVYFRKYPFSVGGFIVTSLISVLIFFVIYPGIVKWVPAMLAGHLPFKNDCREYTVTSPVIGLLVVGFVIAAGFALWYGYKSKNHLLNLVSSSFLLMILGYTTYTQILLRSNANPPMNENEPKGVTELTSYLGREQYGEAPNWPRRYNATDDYFISRYTKKDDNGEFVYGDWIPAVREEATCKDGRIISVPKFKETDFAGEMAYLWKYQINHMYLRYFLWNFVGRKSDTQDASWTFTDTTEVANLNFESGYAYLFPVRFFALPLIFGLIGLFFHFWKDPKMAFAYLVMFIMMGILTAIAQNQQEPQPRERDYFYAGSFYVFCLWIGLSVYGIIDSIVKGNYKTSISAAVIIASIALVPINMAAGGWKMHSRAGNYIPFDYSYNILQSTEKDAILFTNGDNDTFPLWFLQDVIGVRRDVRIVNLSLGNTLWYIDQLKNREPWGAKKIPLSFSNDSLRVPEDDPAALSYDFGEALNVSIPVDKEILKKYTKDTTLINRGLSSFVFMGKPYTQREGKQIYLFRVQDKLILDILRQIKFTRPMYFSVTVGQDAFCGLENYFRYEGMAMKICPVMQKSTANEAIDPVVMEKCLLNVDNSDNFKTTPSYGFKLRNLNNPGVYYDEVHRRLMLTYRTLYTTYANYMLQQGDSAKAVEILDVMNKYISPTQFPISFEMLYQVAKLYNDAGSKNSGRIFGEMGIKACKQLIDNPNLRPELGFYEVTGRYFGPYRRAAYLHEMLGEYTQAKDMLQRFLMLSQQAKETYSRTPGFEQEMTKIDYNIIDILTNIDEFTILEVKKNKGTQAALDTAKSLLEKYSKSTNPAAQRQAMYIQKRIMELGGNTLGDSGLSGMMR